MSAPQQPGFVPFGWALGQPHATALVVVGAELPEAFASFQPMRRVYIEAEAAAAQDAQADGTAGELVREHPDDQVHRVPIAEELPARRPIEKLEPGGELHLCLLGAPWHFNMLRGKEFADVMAFGRAVWDAARTQPATPAAQPVSARLLEAAKACEQFLRVLGLDSEPAAKLAADVRAVIAEAQSAAQDAAATVPAPGSPEASAMIDSVLAEYQWPANPKNAARAGYEAARRMLATTPPAAPQAATVPRLGYWDLTDAERGATPAGQDAAAAVPPWLPMDTAPTNGEAVLLLIEDNKHPLYDETPSVSIGSYGVEGGPSVDPTWHFAGWSWHQDCYCRGEGEPIGWLPIPGATPPAAPQATAGQEHGDTEAMAAVGRALMQAIETCRESLDGWAPMDCPSEIVAELINQRDEARAAATASQAVPMTDADIRRGWAEVSLHPRVDARFVEGVQSAERHHGISDDAAEEKAHG